MAVFFDKTREEERRRFRRLKTSLPVEYRFFDSDRFRQSVTCDISEGGVSFLMDGPAPTGAHLFFYVRLRHKPQPLYGIAKIAWSAPVPYSQKYKVGLEFIETGSISKNDVTMQIKENKVPCYSS